MKDYYDKEPAPKTTKVEKIEDQPSPLQTPHTHGKNIAFKPQSLLKFLL